MLARRNLGMVFIAGLICSSGVFAACPKSVIKLGWEEYTPYQYEESGQVVGSDIDVFVAVMKHLNCAYKLEKSPWERTLMNVQNGEFAFAAGATITEDRKKFAWFSEPYDVEKVFPYVLKKKSGQFKEKNIKAMIDKGYKFVVTSGATFGDEFDDLVKSGKLTKEKNLFEVPSETQAAEMLVVGRVDIFIASGEGLNFNAEVSNLKNPVFTNETRFMLSKKSVDSGFVGDVNKAIKALGGKGTLAEIKKKYFKK
jgi:polar amino acid transport system substrate-binding protein